MTIRKMLIFEEAWECGHRLNGICEHPDRPGSERVCPSAIALWCPLPDAPQQADLAGWDCVRRDIERDIYAQCDKEDAEGNSRLSLR